MPTRAVLHLSSTGGTPAPRSDVLLRTGDLTKHTSGPAVLHTISFLAFLLLVLLTAWVVLMLESGGHRSRTSHEAAKPSDEPGAAAAPDREAA